MSSRRRRLAPGAAQSDAQVTPGEFIVDHPTLINLGFEWLIDGDANRNASVDVSYRRQGAAEWKQGLPLLRLQGERIFQQNSWNLVVPNMFAGSILDLEPDTAYKARFELRDPDGVAGRAVDAVKTVIVRTRPEPVPASGGTVYHVFPADYRGQKTQPAFDGIMCAYYYTCGGGDTTTTARPRVKPGDTILVHAGHYAYHPEFYGPDWTINVTSPFEGTYYLSASGTADRPIAIKAAGDGEVVLDGRGNFTLFNVQAASYNYFEGLTFRNTDIAIWAGRQFIAGSKGLTVKRCRFEDVAMGVFSNYSGSSDFYIADSTFIGRDDPARLLGWSGDYWQQFAGVAGQEFPPVMASYVAVKIYGPGHVVAHNYIANFHDGIDVETYGNPDGSSAIDGPPYPPREFWDRRPVAIDFYNNLLTNFHERHRDRRQPAQHSCHAQSDAQLGVASDVQPAGGRRSRVLDPQHHLSRARRIDADDQRRGGGPLLQQHHPHRNVGGGVGQRALAQPPVPRRELIAGDLQRHDERQLQFLGLQRLPPQSGRGDGFSVDVASVVERPQRRRSRGGICRPRRRRWQQRRRSRQRRHWRHRRQSIVRDAPICESCRVCGRHAAR